ncbi:MAG: protein phosphatase 2C domain-containing protein [Saprospiraceae bacterium]|nr:protein phosphatase 2C domain-containing protein [Saprospiraceae bacterium]
MLVYQLTQIGEFHQNHCEDYVVVHPIASNRHLLAVLDGCSAGEESFFASALIGNILKKIAKQAYYLDVYRTNSKLALSEQMPSVLEQLFAELESLKNQLYLNTNQLLATLLMAVVDEETAEAEVGVFGDGLLVSNGEYWEYDQDNRPDYLAYHLAGDFATWWSDQEQLLSLTDVKDLSLSTDGILSFRNFEAQAYLDPQIPIDHLLMQPVDRENEQMLTKRLKLLKDQYQAQPGDDLGIIRVAFPA